MASGSAPEALNHTLSVKSDVAQVLLMADSDSLICRMKLEARSFRMLKLYLIGIQLSFEYGTVQCYGFPPISDHFLK